MSPTHYLALDLEATCCDQGSVPPTHMETIEIGAVLVAADDFRARDEFQCFVRPVRHPGLTAFCTRLTGIRQADVDAAPPFREAIAAFKAWLYRYADFAFCSWGDYDRKQLQQDCDFHKLPYPISAPHVNAKRLLAERQRLNKKPGLHEAVHLAGLVFLGSHHRGIDDARNVARLLPYVFGSARLTRAPAPEGQRR